METPGFWIGIQGEVALAAVRGDKTTAQVASEFKMHANQAATLKRQLLKHVVGLGSRGIGWLLDSP